MSAIPQNGSRWRHYKQGTVYVVVGLSMRERDSVILVNYVKEEELAAYLTDDVIPWNRPIHEWTADVEAGITVRPRYELLP